MASKLSRLAACAFLAAAPGCSSVQAVGPYVRNIKVNPDGRVSSVERCQLVMHYVGDVLRLDGEECSEEIVGRKPTPPAPPPPPSPMEFQPGITTPP